jgi:transcriptional regulator with XRE-family HTH domain
MRVMPPSRNYNADAARFGAILQRLRIERGWTRARLAARSEMSVNYLSVLEQGRNVPSITTVLELADVLGADAAEIVRQLAVARDTRQPPPAPPEEG